MKDTKVVTVIVNRTLRELVLRVGNNNCFAKVATIVDGGEHKIEIDMNWTYQEFCLEPANAGHVLQKIILSPILSSDDYCDFELMTVTISEGHELGRSDMTYNSSRRATRFTAVAYSDPDHYCQTIPCGYCGRNWPHLTIDTLEGEY